MFSLITYCKRTLYATHNLPKVFVLFVLALSLSACQLFPTQEKIASNSGFGGTGKVATKSGFGGTGIIGTITEFGSIWVNGIKVEYDKNVKVSSNLNPKETLQLGQQVVVETSNKHKQPWTDNIQVFYPLAGLVEKVEDNKIVVDGHSIMINDQTIIAHDLEVKVGSMIAINGYPSTAGHWVAIRLSHNIENKHFYKITPDVQFSKNVTKIVIETNKSQLIEWNKAFSGLKINVIKNPENDNTPQKYLLKADIKKGEITGYHLHDYYRAVSNQKAKPQGEFNQLE